MAAATQIPSERDLLTRLVAGTAGALGKEFLRRLVTELAAALNAEVAFVAELCEDAPEIARTIASAGQPGIELRESYEFALAGTPCEDAYRTDLLLVPRGARLRYPADRFLRAHALDGYLAIALHDSKSRPIGHIGVVSRSVLDPSPTELQALRVFGARAGAELERRRHEQALAASRARAIQAADEERRRIGRDLHDGAQQRVVALGHLVGLVRRQLGDEPPAAAAELLDRALDETRQATDELRELARGLHPAGLAEQGLGPALEALAARSPVPLVVGPMPDRRLPEPVELTAYYLTSEALTNAAKYAGAGQVCVDVAHRPDAAVIVVADDGAGGADPSQGSGLRGLEDRVSALGGTLRIDSAPGEGTRLEAAIPLAPWRTAKEPFLEFGAEGDDGLGLERIARLLDGSRDVSVSLAREWEVEGGLPRIGQHLPVLDHTGRRHGTLEVQRVGVVPFGEVDEIVIPYEASGAATLEEWRASQQRFWELCRDEIALLIGEPGWRLTDEEPMVLTWFRVVDDGDG
jgi:signal transduction histidine kinase/uncharacterized protein YhfF